MNDSGARDEDMAFWQLAHLSNQQLLDGLGARLRSSQRTVAELVAHLGEVEERRLHLHAGCGSMFDYCVKRLGLSEDEACRRIDVARLARRFPAIFPLLARGELSMTVVALLKPHLDETNAPRLLAAVSGCSTAQAREVLVSFFPRPDVPTSVRKLPTRRPVPSASMLNPAPAACPLPSAEASPAVSHPPDDPPTTGHAAFRQRLPASAPRDPVAPDPEGVPLIGKPAQTEPLDPHSAGLLPTRGCVSAPPRIESLAERPTESPPLRQRPPASARIEPLSPARYKLQLTASADLKTKLELARDLLRHAVPGGDYAAIIERALDLLIVDVRKRRFGVGARARKSASAATHGTHAGPAPDAATATATAAVAVAAAPSGAAATPGAVAAHAADVRAAIPLDEVPVDATAETNALATGAVRAPPAGGATAAPVAVPAPGAGGSRYIPRAVRRSVAERDGERCCWVGDDGGRCGERAWLEYDHRRPLGKGGGSGPENIRLFCRAHNRLAAELEYGRDEVARAIENRRRRRGFDGESGQRAVTTPP